MNEMIKELMPYLQKLADKLDSSAQVLWQMQIYQAKVKLISMSIEWLIMIIGWFSVYKGIKYFSVVFETKEKYRDEQSRWKSHEPFPAIGMMIWIVFVFIYSAGCILSVDTLIKLILNPEYWALQEIIKIVK